ncbi:MAG: FtsW/RodA/SpoVE family cell cycle protein [Oscillospiraceae bacterium]|nr:FtsW/RodA/SpoVE family cell cycle protein [Oscillospiraceae bacterium]
MTDIKELKRLVKDFFKKADIFLLAVCLVSTAYGMVLISSAARTMPRGAGPYLMRQAAACGIGVLLFVVITLADVRVYTRLWKWLLIFNVGFISLLYLFGEGDRGNTSWLRFSFLPFEIQPAEVVKITFVLLLGYQMYLLRDRINGFLPMLSILAHVGAMTGLIMFVSNDLGVVFIYMFAFICMAIVGGVNIIWFLSGGLAVGAAMPIVWNYLLGDTQRERVINFFSPESDPLGRGWQVLQSKLAFTRGDLVGTGLYKGPQTQRAMIPEQHTDSIFTAAGEELGFLGAAGVVILLLIIIGRCLYMAGKAPTAYGSVVCGGIAGIMIFQVFENLFMNVGLTPIIGVTLPFFSYGGSSLISMYAAMGIISSIKYHPVPSWIKDRV